MQLFKNMTAVLTALLAVPALLFLSDAAHAEYRCDPAPSNLDRAACAKAKEGPAALNQYIWRMRGIASLQFFDYVNEERARAWAHNSNSAPVKKATAQTAVKLPEYTGA